MSNDQKDLEKIILSILKELAKDPTQRKTIIQLLGELNDCENKKDMN